MDIDYNNEQEIVTEDERLYVEAIEFIKDGKIDAAIKQLDGLLFNESFNVFVLDNKDLELMNAKEAVMESTNDQDRKTKLSNFQDHAIFKLADLYAKKKDIDQLVGLLEKVRKYFDTLAKSKTAKIVRTIIDKVGEIENTIEQQIDLCTEYIKWCKEERRTFLRQRIQTKLANLLVKQGKYNDALNLLKLLQYEVKKMDDKLVLVEIFVTESHAYHALLNVPKAKSSLTAARANSNATYVGVELQSEIDLQSGILNADEKDYRVAFSYFLEAFDGLTQMEDPRAVDALIYMVLCKIMNNKGQDIPVILNAKNAIKHQGEKTQALRALANAYKNSSLKDFDHTMTKYSKVLQSDKFVKHHLKSLHTSLLEKNLIKIIQPYSEVEISHIAKLIDLPLDRVEASISAMILDKKFNGIVSSDVLIVFDDEQVDETYQSSIDLISNLDDLTNSLLKRHTTSNKA